MNKRILYLLIILCLFSNSVFAWLYPEHRDISLLAVKNLSPEYRTILDKLWTEARLNYEFRLTDSVIELEQGVNPEKLDFASWAAISGDHSCSPANLKDNVLDTEWVLEVADIAANLKIDLAEAQSESKYINAIRNSDIKFQRSDPEYATRAASNSEHFLIARESVDTDVREYLKACLVEGVGVNALGMYTLFHSRALIKLSKLAESNFSNDDRSAIILSALFDEAFALHFLQDVFAAGHTVGSWGDNSQRKGTHDYYNEHGLEATTWNGKSILLMGDAYMRPVDANHAAIPVRQSLEQLIDVANGTIKISQPIEKNFVLTAPESFNVCSIKEMPKIHARDEQLKEMLAEILLQTPMPGLETGLGELPRFRTEMGVFVGVVPALRGATHYGGFGKEQNDIGGYGGIDVAIRLGIGLEGVLNESGDGLIFLDFGWRQDGLSSMKYGDSPQQIEGGQITSAIPARDAFIIRLRMPFWLIPGDMLILAPILALTSPSSLATVGIQSVNGGLIPWQSAIATPIGRFQFIIGREIGLTLYGRGSKSDALLIPNQGENNNETTLISFQSTQLDFPILEYRPFRTFSSDQSSSLVVQLTGGIDFPHDAAVIAPEGAKLPELKNVYYLGLRFAFDWRYYL